MLWLNIIVITAAAVAAGTLGGVDSGPYRWVRHPSYTGIFLLMAGLSLVYGNWPALPVPLVLSAGVLIHRRPDPAGVPQPRGGRAACAVGIDVWHPATIDVPPHVV